MRSLKSKGFRAERILANKLWELGFAVVRGGASGGGVRRRFTPDIVAMRSGRIIVLEVKYRSREEPIPIERSRVEKLLDFAKRAGGEVYIAVKYGRREWRFIPLSDLLEQSGSDCENKYIYVRPEHVEKHGLTLRQLAERVLSRPLLSSSSGE